MFFVLVDFLYSEMVFEVLKKDGEKTFRWLRMKDLRVFVGLGGDYFGVSVGLAFSRKVSTRIFIF